MENDDNKNSVSDDILKCRENILKAGGKLSGSSKPISQPSKSQDEAVVTNKPSERPHIPTFEEMVSPTPDPVEIPEIDIPQPAETDEISDQMDASDIFDDVDLSDTSEDLDSSDGSGIEVLADQDWHLPGENTEQPENPTLDNEIEDILDQEIDDEEIVIDTDLDIDQIDPSSPVVTKEEQQELLAEPDSVCEQTDQLEDKDETQIAKQIEDELISLSSQDDDQPQDDIQKGDAIPEFNVYERILSNQRKKSSEQRHPPMREFRKKTELPKPTGTVAEIIDKSKGIDDTPKIETISPPTADRVNITRGVIHGHYETNGTQNGIITDIVTRHIAEYYGKAV